MGRGSAQERLHRVMPVAAHDNHIGPAVADKLGYVWQPPGDLVLFSLVRLRLHERQAGDARCVGYDAAPNHCPEAVPCP